MSDRPKDYAMVTTISTVKTIYMVPMSVIDEECASQGFENSEEIAKQWAEDAVNCEEVRDSGQQFLGEMVMDSHIISEARAMQLFDSHNGAADKFSTEEKIAYIQKWKDDYTWSQRDKKDIKL
jgi:hypothetical protein